MSVRVLVVDDQEPFRRAAAAVVAAAEGFQLVGSAATGEASLLAVEDLQPDLVLMDVHLPGIDGAESTRRIRARQPTHSSCWCPLSDAHSNPEECGAIGYLDKAAPHPSWPPGRLGPSAAATAWPRGRATRQERAHLTTPKER